MKRNLAYLWYILRHKWWVLVASRKVGCSLWRSLVHDWSKFTPLEWITYSMTFYDEDGNTRYNPSPAFDYAWLHHQKLNKHHWQYWLLTTDNGITKPLNIPDEYIKEMVADWMGAGRAITGKWEFVEWYENNKKNMVFSDQSRAEVEGLLYRVRDNNTF